MRANPILEAFGNAKTVRNDNSSRFGRWMELHFFRSGLKEGSIAGAFVENYLLEKSRVTQQGAGERSYHIFYQLCRSSWAPALSLQAPEAHRYLAASGCTSIENVDDAADFGEVAESLAGLGFGQEDMQWLFFLVAATLHLGDVAFASAEGGEGSAVEPHSHGSLSLAAHYLQVPADDLATALTQRTIVVRGEAQRLRNRREEAHAAADALAKAVYAALFDELVRRINGAVGGERGMSIGVLDIFGFEIFEHNSFEQLCINFTNEKLQGLFNEHTFQAEESLYEREGVPHEKVLFIDNKPVLELLHSKPCALPMRIPRQSQHLRRLPAPADASLFLVWQVRAAQPAG